MVNRIEPSQKAVLGRSCFAVRVAGLEVRLSQTVHGAQTSPSGFFVPVPAGGAMLLDPVSLFVPDALGASAQIRARVDRVFSNLVSGPVQGPRSFETVKPVSGVSEPPYRVTAAPALALYDQDKSVILTGEARDPADQLVPGATVQVGVSLRGFDRVASTRTDGLGQYQITFTPAPGDMEQELLKGYDKVYRYRTVP